MRGRERIKPVVAILMLLFSTALISTTAAAADGDGDGVDDALDDCPFAAGNSTIGMQACPDSDGDGYPDHIGATTGDWNNSVRSLYVNQGDSRAVAWAPDSVHLAGAADGDVTLYTIGGATISTLFSFDENVRGLEFSPNGSYLAASAYFSDFENHSWAVVLEMNWTTKSATLLQNLSSMHTDDVPSVAWSSDGAFLFTGDGEGQLRQFSVHENWSMVSNYSFQPGATVWSIDVSPDGRLVAGLGGGGNLKVFWTSNGTEYMNLNHHQSTYALDVTFSPDGRWLLTGAFDNRVNIYNVTNASHLIGFTDSSRDVYSISFDPSGAFFVVGGGDDEARVYNSPDYQTDLLNYSEIYQFGSFGSGQSRGVRAIEWSPDGMKIGYGQNRGRTGTYILPGGFLQLKGDYTSVRMLDNSWENSYPSVDGRPLSAYWHENYSTADLAWELCNGDNVVGTLVKGIPHHLVTPQSNWSSSGLLDCSFSTTELIEVPVGRMPASLIVKANGSAENCLTTIGGLSMGQLRWIFSGSSELTLSQPGWAPGLDLASIVPNDDGDSLREWSDLDPACSEIPLHVSGSWDNRSIPTMVQRELTCGDCQFSEGLFHSDNTSNRYRFQEEDRSQIPYGISLNDNILGFTEMRDVINRTDVWNVPLVDNWTHGFGDALSDGGTSLNASINGSAVGTWPLQEDYVFIVNTAHLPEMSTLLNWMLTDAGQAAWDSEGFVHLGLISRVDSWARIGIDAIHILPDIDNDGLWDGVDDCDGPTTDWDSSIWELDRDGDGCHDSTEDDDDDGDGILDFDDKCDSIGDEMNWTSTTITDHDGDGCRDDAEDDDDDNDGIDDMAGDVCLKGWSNWTSNQTTDHDGDGCKDNGEDADDDNDGVDDFGSSGAVLDLCPYSGPGWISTPTNDRDGDGCEDTGEDLDDDGDGILDDADLCDGENHKSDWLSDTTNDHDQDGCHDEDEDDDDDGDGIGDVDGDACSRGSTGWLSDSQTDYDGDGCKDDGEDSDDDGDGKSDDDDNCPWGETGWLSSPETDYDGDGCRDASEDADDDDDGFYEENGDDHCPGTALGAYVDSFGCVSVNPEYDADSDGVADSQDNCQNETATGWDLDSDGCIDDGDNDGFKDDVDDCIAAPGVAIVGDDGCTDLQRDDDGDGTPGDSHGQGDDECPGTPALEETVMAGCSQRQLEAINDDDDDGIVNLDDLCPDTPSSEVNKGFTDDGVDDDGCTYSQQDADGDEVPNTIDFCPGTPNLHQVDEVGCAASQLAGSEGYSTSVIVAGFAGASVLIIALVAAAYLVLKKKPKPKRRGQKPRPAGSRTSTQSETAGINLVESGEDLGSGYSEDAAEADAGSGVTIDEHGTEWYSDDEEVWWYRNPDMDDWAQHEQ
jgi:WD40 repeat protein